MLHTLKGVTWRTYSSLAVTCLPSSSVSNRSVQIKIDRQLSGIFRQPSGAVSCLRGLLANASVAPKARLPSEDHTNNCFQFAFTAPANHALWRSERPMRFCPHRRTLLFETSCTRVSRKLTNCLRSARTSKELRAAIKESAKLSNSPQSLYIK